MTEEVKPRMEQRGTLRGTATRPPSTQAPSTKAHSTEVIRGDCLTTAALKTD